VDLCRAADEIDAVTDPPAFEVLDEDPRLQDRGPAFIVPTALVVVS